MRHLDAFSFPQFEDRAELFVDSVPGGRNDIKMQRKNAAPFGNFLFGAEAAARGMSLQEALNWAAKAQIVQDLKAHKWPSGADNKDDPPLIKQGYRYFIKGCSRP